MILCQVDSGKRWSKGLMVDKDGNIVRLKNATSANKLKENTLDTGIKVIFKNVEYMVGEESDIVTSENSRNETKLTAEHKISTLTLIAQLLDEAGYDHIGEHITLGVNVPVSDYKIDGKAKEYEDYYVSDEVYKITVNGHEYKFYIDAVLPMYEGSGTLMKYAQICQEERDVIIVNFGSLNTTFVYFEDMAPVAKWSNSLSNGCNIFINNLKTKMTGHSMSEKQIQRILEGDKRQIDRLKRAKNGEVFLKMIQDEAESEVKKVFRAIADLDVPVSSAYVIASGGGVYNYESALKKFFNEEQYDYTISEECVYDDALGMLSMLSACMSDVEE